MPVSVFQLFSIGIGPSSSHTVGPMRAAKSFIDKLDLIPYLEDLESITVELFGSLAMTGVGHATDIAILLGLSGYLPEEVDPAKVETMIGQIRLEKKICIGGMKTLDFDESVHLLFEKGKRLPYHSNAMRFRARFKGRAKSFEKLYYSVGGGFVVEHELINAPSDNALEVITPYPFTTCKQLLEHCERENKKIYEIVLENEKVLRSEQEIRQGILKIWAVMKACVERGCAQEGYLPGGLQVKRRAKAIHERLTKSFAAHHNQLGDPVEIFDWVSLFALAVNEENAAGGKVVTAPTNGAAGIIPAVLHFYEKFTPNPSEEGIIQFFLTATAIGILYKEGASLSAAEMGCQGEVGVACSMAAGALTAALGGDNAQIENAAEIGMEHNLGLTCDPVGGLVQIPCIERNTMGAIKAINAMRLAMQGTGESRVTLDQVIATMRQTGIDMNTVYKETSEGGLALQVAVNLVEC